MTVSQPQILTFRVAFTATRKIVKEQLPLSLYSLFIKKSTKITQEKWVIFKNDSGHSQGS